MAKVQDLASSRFAAIALYGFIITFVGLKCMYIVDLFFLTLYIIMFCLIIHQKTLTPPPFFFLAYHSREPGLGNLTPSITLETVF